MCALRSTRDRIERIKGLTRQVRDIRLTDAARIYDSGTKLLSRPRWWLHSVTSLEYPGAEDTLRKIYQDPQSRCAWAYLVGMAITPNEDQYFLYGAVHCWPMWTSDCPAENLPSCLDLARELGAKMDLEGVALYHHFLKSERARASAARLKAPIELIRLYTNAPPTRATPCAFPIVYHGEVIWIKPAPQLVGNQEVDDDAPGPTGIFYPPNAARYGIIDGRFHVSEAGPFYEDDEPEEEDFLCFIQSMLCLIMANVTEVQDVVTYAAIMALVPCIVNGAYPTSISKIEKHFGNIGQVYGVSVGDLRVFARGAHLVWPHLQALMTPVGAAQGVMAMMMSQRNNCIWYGVLASRMEGYGFTALHQVIAALIAFPIAPWSMFFSRSDFEAEEYTAENLNIHAPYPRYNKLIKWAISRGVLPKSQELITESTPSNIAEELILSVYNSFSPKDGEFPELKIQGDNFLDDYIRWAEDSLIMYTGIEGLSSQYPDLAYFSVQLNKKWLPGTQIGGYQGAPAERCKMLPRITRILESFGEVLEAVEIDDRLLDMNIQKKILAVVKGEEAFTHLDMEILSQAIPKRRALPNLGQ